MKKVGFNTLGCKVNQYETQVLIEIFQKAGYEIVNFNEYANIYIINTCTVTSFADKKSRQAIRRARRNNPEAVIVAMGCYSQISPADIEKLNVNVITGTVNRTKILELVKDIDSTKKIKSISDVMKQKKFEEMGSISCGERTRAAIKIQDGCNNFCSYCIIPYARGSVRSRTKANILKEVNSLVQNGFKEIVLTGIQLSSYGKDLKDTSLIDIIEEISKIEQLKRIRLGSLEPNLISQDFILRAKNISKLCPHFHISLQSGSDEVLKRMNRKYSAGFYKERVKMLRDNIFDASITTDIMVGFPGETQKEFEETYKFLDKISLSKTHVFKYSPRNGTKAAQYSEQVDTEIKEKRSDMLIKLSDKKETEFKTKFLGTTMEVLFEQQSSFSKHYIEGHTPNFINVAVKSDKSLVGKLNKVKLQSCEKEFVIGQITE